MALKPTAARAAIGDGERESRLHKAQKLMTEHKSDANFMGVGNSLNYFTGIRWRVSERTIGMLLPKSCNPVFITPAFERERTWEQIRFGKKDIRTWQENESPYKLIADLLDE